MSHERMLKGMKELLVECMGRKQRPHFMFNDLTIDNLEQTSCWDVDKLEAEDGWHGLWPTMTLDTLLDKTDIAQCNDETQVQHIRTLMDDPSISKGVNLLLDEELDQLGMASNKYKDASTKALIVSNIRLYHKLRRSPRNPDTEFTVTLTTIIDGHGSNVKREVLYFAWDTKWPCFLETLQRATKGSVIPPRDLSEMHEWTELRKKFVPLSASATLSSSKENSDTCVGDGKGLTSTPAYDASIQDGYSLKHGPWLYQIFVGDHSKTVFSREGDRIALNTAKEFEGMVAEIRKGRWQRPKKERRVVITHQLDRIAMKQWQEIQRAEAAIEEQFREECRRAGIDEDDIGIPFSQYLGNPMEG